MVRNIHGRRLRIGLTLLLFLAAAMPTLADLTSDERLIDAAAKAALIGSEDGAFTRAAVDNRILTSDIVIQNENNIAFGMIVVRAQEGVHGAPELRLFLARRSANDWKVALEYTPKFYKWLSKAPDGLMSLSARSMLLEAAVSETRGEESLAAPQGNGASLLNWPFQLGETWTFIGGPHGNNGDSNRPWTALDLGVEGIGRVRAARDGIVWRSASCPNFVRIDHNDGWQTGYYHLSNEQVSNGQFVERGRWLGNTSNGVGCGGWSSGPHTHFTLRRYNSYLNIAGHDVGGWTIEEGSAAYGGCAKRVRDQYRVCKPYGQVYNDGSIGSGDYKERHDYNADAVPDVWAVNMRDAGTNSTSVYIASGTNLQNRLLGQGTGMPQQPDYLNTAFAAADYNNDRVPDLYVIHRLDGSNTTALRVMNGADLRWLLLDTTTALPPYDNSVSFAVSDYNRDGAPDLWAINPRDPATNSVSVRIASGKNWNATLANTGTALPKQSPYADVNFAAADYDADGIADLWAIYPRDTEREAVSVKIISGKDWQTVLVDKAVALPMLSTDITVFGFMVADLDVDFTPDLWYVDRRNSTVTVLSGDDFTTTLRTGKAALPTSYGPDWHILGSDRAREALAPSAPAIVTPAMDTQLNKTNVRFEWQPAPLAREYVLSVKEPGKTPIVLQRFTAAQACNARICRVGSGSLGVVLQDDKTYRWKVKAINAYGKTKSQNMRIFTDIPGAPTLTVPDGIEFPSAPIFLWTGTEQTVKYRLFIQKTDGTLRIKPKIKAATCPQQQCIYIPTETLPDGEYRWMVRAIEPTVGGTSESEWRTFTIQTSPTLTPDPSPTPTNTPTETATPTETTTPTG